MVAKLLMVNSVGSACYCKQLKIQISEILNNLTSIYTAECIAINNALKIALENQQFNIVIVSDSLSALEALQHPKFTVKTNYYILEIRRKITEFETNNIYNTNVRFIWVPSHIGITDNETVDHLAKAATEIDPTVKTILYSDLRNSIKNKAKLSTVRKIEQLGLSKGVFYFENYHNNRTKPWFYNRNIDRELINTINRCRSGHINLKESLFKINVVQDTLCECGMSDENLNHIIWQCKLYDQQRSILLNKLLKHNLVVPLDIRNFLIEPNVKIMRYILKFFQNCAIKV